MAETINTPTRTTLNSQTCLDQIIVDSDKFPFKTENVNMGISILLNIMFLHRWEDFS